MNFHPDLFRMSCRARNTLCLVFVAAQRCQDCIESTERPFPRLRGPVTLTQVDGPFRGVDGYRQINVYSACMFNCLHIWLYIDYQRTYDIYYTVYIYIPSETTKISYWVGQKYRVGHLEWFLVTVVIWAMKKTPKLVGLYRGWIKNYTFIQGLFHKPW